MSSRWFHFWAQCQMLVLSFSVVHGMPISETIHNQIIWNRVQHLAIIKDMWGLTSSRVWGYNNFASVSQLIANYRFATQDESSCPKLSNAVTASMKAQFSQCKQLALTIHYGKDCYLVSTSSSIFLHSESSALDLQYTQSILLLPWLGDPNIWQNRTSSRLKPEVQAWWLNSPVTASVDLCLPNRDLQLKETRHKSDYWMGHPETNTKLE